MSREGFIRIATHPRALSAPIMAWVAFRHAQHLAYQNQCVKPPGQRPAQIFFGLLDLLGTVGNLTTDAHIATIEFK